VPTFSTNLRCCGSAAMLLLASCGHQEEQAPSAPPVDVVAVRTGEVPNIVELPGRIEAVRTAEVRARVDGIVERRLYQEGSDVPAGAPLFRIDPRDKQAQLAQAQAALNRAMAARANARSVVARYEPLVSRKAVSAQEYDAALSDARQADASVSDARAALDRVRLELGYTTVRAPIAGRVGKAQVTEGALVSASSATLLTQVNQLSPIYATFTESSSKFLDVQQLAKSGVLRLPDLNAIEVRLVLENGAQYGLPGHLDFADQTVDPSTGSQTLRARFPNPDRLLLPGQFVRARIIAGSRRDGIAIPERAVQISNEEASVLIVGRDNLVAKRTVELGGQSGGKWVVLSGLRSGDLVIVDGWMKVQPGQKVAPRKAGAAAAAGKR
jgi:membrane fusion protein (multidrug efflux system)